MALGASTIATLASAVASPAHAAPAKAMRVATAAAYSALYRIATGDATAIGALVTRTFPRARVTIERELNAVVVYASATDQKHIAEAIAQVDVTKSAPSPPLATPGLASPPIDAGATTFDVYTLRAALPGINGAASTSASDIATTVTQALAQSAPDLRITVAPTTNQLIISGSASAMNLARQLIDRLDVAQKLVVLDTQVLELDESVSKNLGLSFTQPVVSTNYSEVVPPLDAAGNAQRLLGFGPLTRTPLSLGLTLNLAIAQGHGRVLANPRITTISGRTATIRAGDTISIQTTAGGGAGTVATTQLQTFQTGVTLDITPIVNAGDFISVLLHPTVNSNLGFLNGIPQISTRDTQTTVALREDETLIIGGLIQENNTRTDSKIPLLGDLPVLGRAFRNNQLNSSRNELVITVTPHIVAPGGGLATRAPADPMSQPFPTPRVAPGATYATPTSAPPARAIAPPRSQAPSALGGSASGRRANAYTYGTIPATDGPSSDGSLALYYATISPTLPWLAKTVDVTAITSTNVQRLTMTYAGGFSVSLAQGAAGHWRASFPFPAAAAAALGSDPSVTFRAVGTDGSANAAVVVPLVDAR